MEINKSTKKVLGYTILGLLAILFIIFLSVVTNFKVAITIISVAICITYVIAKAVDFIS